MNKVSLIALLGFAALSLAAGADEAPRVSALARMPVREITVFKDGHTFVLHQGTMPTDAAGNVEMDYLPTPVLGTFWPYSASKQAKLESVTASPRRVLVERTALSLQELLQANAGAEVTVTQNDGKVMQAQLLGLPVRTSDELTATGGPNAPERLPEMGSVMLMKTTEGVAVIAMDHIKDVTFRGPYKHTLAAEEFRNLLTLKLQWAGGRPERTAEVGMVYLQKGIRWIPSYKVTLDGKGEAEIALQATLINEMTDLKDVTANLVIGVPSFAFQDTPDPISLQQTFAQLSPYFQADSRTAYGFSNAIMSQAAYARGAAGPAGPAGADAPGPEVGGSGKNEDTFIFTVNHITLKKGERMSVPIATYPLKYRDKYTLDLPIAPPRDLRGNINPSSQAEIAKLMTAPKVIHKICLTVTGKYPLTTAPALIMHAGQVIAQGLMTYAAVGGDADLDLTTAVDIRVKKTDKETKRTPNAVQWQGSQFARVDLQGSVTLTNLLEQPVDVEVTRSVLGAVDSADHGGVPEMVNVVEDDDITTTTPFPQWWGYYNWPSWWSHFNGIGRIRWTVHVDAGKAAELHYAWHYFWQ